MFKIASVSGAPPQTPQGTRLPRPLSREGLHAFGNHSFTPSARALSSIFSISAPQSYILIYASAATWRIDRIELFRLIEYSQRRLFIKMGLAWISEEGSLTDPEGTHPVIQFGYRLWPPLMKKWWRMGASLAATAKLCLASFRVFLDLSSCIKLFVHVFE